MCFFKVLKIRSEKNNKEYKKIFDPYNQQPFYIKYI